ncbi:alpha/beta hydrolase [Reichenbachiella carrageenanivorans]|uniref:Alpha/beta hydrolase n=1 Tax=Reichenbachiella carrageenanivorans TaxID=2979869 RepID=A0ABY6D549_9BACT|nr:alpha/beta hydrolase [Reichenbachiella carrageenanivorans]UXX81297.1 alpha/beta hydrolase [Reichenbachiella carrageenanivorans]
MRRIATVVLLVLVGVKVGLWAAPDKILKNNNDMTQSKSQRDTLIQLYDSSLVQEPEILRDTEHRVLKYTKVSSPVVELFIPNPAKDNGKTLIVCPGGGYQLLAMDLEGYEVVDWLTGLGYSVGLLQYSVPQQKDRAMQDLKKAVDQVRQWMAVQGKSKLGVMGFSAGAHLSLRSSSSTKEATPVADVDFVLAIYPAYLDHETPIEWGINKNMPDTFIFSTADDGYGQKIPAFVDALSKIGINPFVRILPDGGHGYGLRKGNVAAETWPKLAEAWMAKQ